MKSLLIIVIFCLINNSMSSWWDTEPPNNVNAADLLIEEPDLSSKTGVEGDEPIVVANLENDQNSNEATPESEPQPMDKVEEPALVHYNPTNEQNRGSADRLPEPDYRAVNVRDYLPQTCHSGQYMCQKTDPNQQQIRCIPQEWRCNGLRDCENNDDENGCNTDQLTRGRTQSTCSAEQYQCHGSGTGTLPPQCIDRRFMCDGTYHCSYGDDEANCVDRRNDRRDDRGREQPIQPREEPPREDPYPNRSQDRPDTRDRLNPQTSGQTSSSGDRKSDDYVQRLEWRDRCFRSCLKY